MRVRSLVAVLAATVLFPFIAFSEAQAAPTASLTLSSPTVTSGATAYMYGYYSCCNITNYQFDFGDGSAVAGRSSSASHRYYNYGSAPVSFTVRLTVTDNTGASTTVTATQVVAPDYAPVARLSVSSNTTDSSGLSIYADGSASSDADADGFSPPHYFEFDFGDGTGASTQGTGVTGHKYAAPGTYTVTLRVYDTQWQSGPESTATTTVTVPSAPPSPTPSAPTSVKLKMVQPQAITLSGGFKVQLAIGAPTNSPVAICNYRIDRAIDGVWSTRATQSGTTYTTSALTPGSGLYQFRVWSIGCNGTVSSVATSSAQFRPTMSNDSAFNMTSAWTRTSDANAYGGGLATTTTINASATYTGYFLNAGLIVQKSPKGGKINVYLDGVLYASVNLYAPSLQQRQVVFKGGYAPPMREHTIKVVLVGNGSGGGKTLALDGLITTGG